MDGTEPGPLELAPFFPDPRACGPLLDRAAELVAEGHRLEAANAPLAHALQPLLVSINACHASELDGWRIGPLDLFSTGDADHRSSPNPADPRHEQRQRAIAAARAHAAAETALSAALPQRSVALYAPEFVQCIHAELHRGLLSRDPAAPEAAIDELAADASGDADLAAASGDADPSDASGDSVATRARGRPASSDHAQHSPPRALDDAPGAWRRAPVGLARGAPPEHIPDLLDQWQGIYSKPFSSEQALIAALCAGHRLLAVRPFERGNGRTARLHTQLALAALGVTQGQWSPLRAIARDRDTYRHLLRRALPPAPPSQPDARRDPLAAYCAWLLDASLAEARAARERLDPKRLEPRLNDLLAWLAAHPWVIGSERSVIKPDALQPLHYAAITGPIDRARFIAMLGLQHRTARRVLSSLLDCGLLASDTSRAPVRFNLPWPSLRFLFPDLCPPSASPHAAPSLWPGTARASTSGAHPIPLDTPASSEESRSIAS